MRVLVTFMHRGGWSIHCLGPAFVDRRPVIVADRHLTAQGKRYAGRNILRKDVFWYPTHPACWVIQYPVP
jgi:hypothetical protein